MAVCYPMSCNAQLLECLRCLVASVISTAILECADDDVTALHPAHTAESVRKLLPRLHHFAEGICVVHHMFGSEVTDLVKRAYPDAHLAAHFEVRAL